MSLEYIQQHLNMVDSSIIVLVFSFIVVGMDEFVIKGWRQRHWEKLAASGDKEKAELLAMAKSAHVVDE